MALSITKPTSGSASFFGTTTSDDFILGSASDDTITGGVQSLSAASAYLADGADTMEGGLGDDKYIVNDSTDVITEYAGEGTDTVFTTVSYTLGGELEYVVAAGTTAITLTGNSKDNVLDGSQGTGADTLVGGSGNDYYIIGTGDVINKDTGGIDTVETGSTIDISATTAFQSLENVSLSGSSAANITGNDSANRLTGNSGNNSISGGKGNDIIDTGTGGTDTLVGGDGNDTFIIRTGATVASITDSAGTDKVLAFATLAAGSGIENVTLLGTSAADISVTDATLSHVLIGNSAANSITGNAKNDTLTGGAGADTLTGAAGNDTYYADTADSITDTSGTDTLQVSGSGTLTLTDSSNIETITVSGENNTGVNGAAETTVAMKMTGDDGNNTLTGGSLNDSIVGGDGGEDKDGDNVLDAGEDTDGDSVLDTDGNDSLSGGAGNDTLVGGDGTNTLVGGIGNDLFIVKSATTTLTEAASAGTDTVQFSGEAANDTLAVSANVEIITLTGTLAVNATAAGSTANTMSGNTADNSLDGGGGNDSISGNSGSDSLTGGAGNDTINGGTNSTTAGDTMVGNAGNDYYYVDDTDDVVTEITGEGTDTVESTVSFTLSTFLEKLTLSGSLAIGGEGNDSANTISGNNGNNTLTGNDGDDTINGGSGNDTINGGVGRDSVTGGSGNDTIVYIDELAETFASATSISSVDIYKDLTLNDLAGDRFNLSVAVADVGTAVSGVINEADFETDLNALLTATGKGFVENTAGIDAVVVTGTSGDLKNHKFLVVDLDGSDTFTVAADFVVEITGSSVTNLTTDTFL